MRRSLLFVLAAMFILHATTAGAQAVNRAAVQTAIIANEKTVNDAFVKSDMKTFHTFVTPDAVAVDGMGITKAADFDKMMADYKVQSYTITGSQFIWLDDSNVIHIFHWTGKGATYKGQPAPGESWASTAWSNKGGKWLATFHQETIVMPPPAPMAAPKAAAPIKK